MSCPHTGRDAPSFTVDSAEGPTTFTGLDDRHPKTAQARAWICREVAALADAQRRHTR
jgi:hypothetical protein